MALIVQKFGGSSVGDIDRIKRVAKIIQRTYDQGHQVVAVVSAMQGETDRLIGLARTVTNLPNPREYDALISTGEQVAAALLSMALLEGKYPSRSYNATQIAIRTDSRHKKANILNIDKKIIAENLKQKIIPVVTGFQGVDDNGQVTTLGRGGSDMTAVALAAALGADECQIYTDVAGVYTTDPNIVKHARKLSEITFDEMLELSQLGAKVLQIRAVEYANKHNVPVRVLSSFADGPGTLITYNNKSVQPKVSGIAFDRNQAKLTLHGLPNRTESITHFMHSINSANIDVDMVVQNVPTQEDKIDFSFTVHNDDYVQALDISKKMANELRAEAVIGNNNVAKLSIVGIGIQSHAGIASKMFQVLGQEEIKVHLITASEIKISVIIDEKYTELGVRILHSAFGLDDL